jgi:hypothetical protein
MRNLQTTFFSLSHSHSHSLIHPHAASPALRFLKYATTGKTVIARQPAGQARKPVNFHTYFAVQHAMEAEQKDRMLKWVLRLVGWCTVRELLA